MPPNPIPKNTGINIMAFSSFPTHFNRSFFFIPIQNKNSYFFFVIGISEAIFVPKINKLLNIKLIEISENNKYIRLTEKGLDLANIVWEEFI